MTTRSWTRLDRIPWDAWLDRLRAAVAGGRLPAEFTAAEAIDLFADFIATETVPPKSPAKYVGQRLAAAGMQKRKTHGTVLWSLPK